MKSLKIIVAAGLLTASVSAVAGEAGMMSAMCPPASAFKHDVVGQPWALSEKYTQNFMVVQTPFSTWSTVTSISSNALLSVRVVDEAAYKQVGQDKFDFVESLFPVTCAYLLKDRDQHNVGSFAEVLFVKSNYSSEPWSIAKNPNFGYQNDYHPSNPGQQGQPKKPEANWGWVCNSTATNPERCKLDVLDPSQPRMATSR